MIKLSKILPYIILIIAVISLNFSNKIFSTYLVFSIAFLIFFIVVLSKNKISTRVERKNLIWLNLYLLCSIISIIYGVLVADNYWDYKALVENSFGLLMPFMAYISLNPKILQHTINKYVLFALPVFLLFMPFLEYVSVYGFYISALYLILLFIPIIPKRWRYIILILSIFIITISLDDRAVILRLIIAILFSLLYYYRKIIGRRFFWLLARLIFVLPIVFFIIAIITPFNILKIDEYYQSGITYTEKVGNRIVKQDLLVDTRARIYNDAISTAKEYNSWWFGISPARGYITSFGTDFTKKETGINQRYHSELGVVNAFVWTGIVGVVLYFMMLFRASYWAIKKSNNIWAKILGLYLAFRWIIYWVEDIQNFTLNNYILMLMIGLAYADWFRNMTNKEVEIWVRGIFIRKYRLK